MGTQKNTVTINGKVYDIAKGQVIDSVSARHINHQVSDIIRPTKPKTQHSHHTQNHDAVAKPTPTKARTTPASVNHAKRKVAKTQTLARNYVKKPTPAKTANSVQPSSPRVVELHKSVNHHRLSRAKQVQRSNSVSKFSQPDVRRVSKKLDHIPVVAEPKPTNHSRSTNHSNQRYDISHTPPVSNLHKTSKPKPSSDIFESALSASKSHRQTYSPKKKHRSKRGRWASIAAGSLTAVLLIAFFVYQNIPSIALYTTSSKVGFNVSKPSYQPAGFGLKGPLTYESGKVVLDFRSNSDDKNYKIEQTKTELDSASLLNDYLTNNGKDYTTEFANGRTVYIYGQNNATWVDGGIWYNLTNQANLSSDQLLKIVSSI